MIVSGALGFNVASASFPCIDEIGAAPCEFWLPELARQKIADKSRETSIAVRKRVNGDKAMAEPHSDFVRWIC